MKKKRSLINIVAFIILMIPFKVFPAETDLSVQAIVEKAVQAAYYQGKDGRAQVSMTITDAQNRKRTRRFTLLRRNVSEAGLIGDQQFYVYFQRPADVNKTVFMVLKHINKDDDRWLYLPALDLVKRIAATDERTSFVGSDFLYEDVSGRGPDEDQHTLLETNKNFYVIESRPKNPSAVAFESYKSWIHRSSFIPIKIAYFNKNKENYRTYEALKIEKIQGFQTVVQARMKDLRTKSETMVHYNKVEYNLNLPEEIFTERYLRNPPKRYLR